MELRDLLHPNVMFLLDSTHLEPHQAIHQARRPAPRRSVDLHEAQDGVNYGASWASMNVHDVNGNKASGASWGQNCKL